MVKNQSQPTESARVETIVIDSTTLKIPTVYREKKNCNRIFDGKKHTSQDGA
jgi:hypothetical protein